MAPTPLVAAVLFPLLAMAGEPPKPAATPTAAAPGTPVWVLFTNKGLTPESRPAALAAAAESLTPRAVQRRQLRRTAPGLVDERDVALNPAYAAAAEAVAGPRRAESRWLNAISIDATPDEIARLRELPFVKAVQPVRRGEKPAVTVEPAGGYTQRTDYGRATNQLAQINVIAMHDRGFTGQGVIIGVLDTGFERSHLVFNNPLKPFALVAERDFINNDGNTAIEPADDPGQHSHGTLVLSTIGGYLPGELVGGAFDASFILCKTEDVTSETPVEEDYYVAGIEFIELHGGDVATSSLSYSDWYTQADMNGLIGVTSIALNAAAENGLHCVTAAGNAGHDEDPATSRLGAPADALRVITCGSNRGNGLISSFSSDGPTADGRVKPEVLARGSGVAIASPNAPDEYATANGTSLSTPLVAGAVACLVQAHPTWTVDQLRHALFTTAGDFAANGVTDPLFIRGHGIINTTAAADATVPQPCPADIDGSGGVDGDDITVFFGYWQAGAPEGDIDRSGGTDGDDIGVFFGFWQGGC